MRLRKGTAARPRKHRRPVEGSSAQGKGMAWTGTGTTLFLPPMCHLPRSFSHKKEPSHNLFNAPSPLTQACCAAAAEQTLTAEVHEVAQLSQ
eukprot:scaffold191080_cov21-Tisochrysis_lutea.AAC.1